MGEAGQGQEEEDGEDAARDQVAQDDLAQVQVQERRQ